MVTAIILMCTMDLECYSVVNDYGFFSSIEECRQSVKEFINSEEFDPGYRFFVPGKTFNVYDVRCINWKDTEV